MRKTTWTASDHASSPGRRCSDGGVAISPRSDMAPRIFSPSATQIEAPGVSLYLQRARLCLRAVDLFVPLLKPCTHRRFRRRIWRRRTWWLRGGDALEAADGKRGGHHCGLGARLAAPPTPARPRASALRPPPRPEPRGSKLQETCLSSRPSVPPFVHGAERQGDPNPRPPLLAGGRPWRGTATRNLR